MPEQSDDVLPTHSSQYYTPRDWERAVGYGTVPPKINALLPENREHLEMLRRQERRAALRPIQKVESLESLSRVVLHLCALTH